MVAGIIRGVTTAGDRGDASPVRPTMSPLHQLVDICVPRKPMAPSAQSAAVSQPTGHWTLDSAQLQQQQQRIYYSI